MSSSKLKREECRQTKHDSDFSTWKVLVGPSDWSDYLLGKDGVTRYRIHNLPPNCSCPGLYELGIAVTPADGGNKTRQHDVENIVVVYLGQADNVRTRLQEYGRAGSHLDHGNSLTVSNTKESPFHPRGPSLFKDVFSKGYSIVYRWSPMKDKKEAEKMETRLLQHFDYAWNRRLNGASRHEEILRKLENAPTKWKQPLFGKKPGIKIDEDFPLYNNKSGNKMPLLPQNFELVKFQPQIVRNEGWLYNDPSICGVSIGSGRICRNKPVDGRKRCFEHKGMRITYAGSPCGDMGTTSADSEQKLPNNRFSSEGWLYNDPSICGVSVGSGRICRNKPVDGRKRCFEHKGRRITYAGSPCRDMWTTSADSEQKLPNNRFSSEGKLLPKTELPICKSESDYKTNGNDIKYEICGVILADGLTCMERPVLGRKRCQQHKGQRVTGSLKTAAKEYSIESAMSVCGVHLDNGSICMNLPISGRKRCAVHKGRRVG